MATTTTLLTSTPTETTAAATVSAAQAVLDALASVITAARADIASATSSPAEVVAAQSALAAALVSQQQYQALVAPTSTHNYTVVQGDTLESIAQRQLGDFLQFPAIQAANGMKGRYIVPGQVLTLPPT